MWTISGRRLRHFDRTDLALLFRTGKSMVFRPWGGLELLGGSGTRKSVDFFYEKKNPEVRAVKMPQKSSRVRPHASKNEGKGFGDFWGFSSMTPPS